MSIPKRASLEIELMSNERRHVLFCLILPTWMNKSHLEFDYHHTVDD
jgi:hypothetical protein